MLALRMNDVPSFRGDAAHEEADSRRDTVLRLCGAGADMSVPELDDASVPTRQVRRLSLRGAAGAVGRARDFVRRALADWRWRSVDVSHDEAVEDVLLVVSELVANATVHGGGATEIALALDADLLSVSVTDSGSARPAFRQQVASRPSGHGLHVVEALTTVWGVTPGPHGKAVWADFRS